MRDAIWAYIWDLADEGIDIALEKIRSSGGLQAVSLATTYHAGRLLLPHNPRRKIVFLEDGTAYFRPDGRLYGRIRLIPNSYNGPGDPLDRARTASRKHDLALNAWCSFCHNTALGIAYPDCTIENAFGDRYLHSLCPSHPDVQEFTLAVVEDIARNHDVDSIEIESLEFLLFRHGFHHEREGIELTPAIEFLLSVCFCQQCAKRMASAVDAAPLRETVTRKLETFLREPYATPQLDRREIIEWLGNGAAEFLAAREKILGDLHRRVLNTAHRHRKRVRRVLRPAASCWNYGIAPSALASDEFVLLAYHPYLPDFRASVTECTAMVSPEQLAVGMRPGHPDVRNEDELRERMWFCHSNGVHHFSFFNYGMMRLRELEAIGRALRSGWLQ